MLLSRAWRMVGNSGEDAVQEAYCRALKYWKSYDFNRDFNGWIFGLFNNTLRSVASEEKRHGMIYRETEMSKAHLLPSKIGNPHKTRELTELITRIRQEPENRSFILQLALIDQYTSAEVADLVPENEKCINNIVYRFRKENRKEFR
ncbi:hypothetical protein LCGC14_3142660 [marine sediment metagenome]|uniref:RNA polymerase sigma-70 region 2 domain-containing protein n=1 Tax=marine sediment metagenome TaxID=412755 RepID=A0A0F8Y397_9ZZZZ